jgi:UDP-2,3-diacylglucosamine hydrolase
MRGRNGMKALFFSDAHLRGAGSATQEKILRFFDGIRGRYEGGGGTSPSGKMKVDLLVIAGDFFDFWFARGEVIYPGFRHVVDRIATLKQEGVRIVLCEGNHDFFLDGYFTDRLGIEVYPEAVDLEMDGLRVLVSHGDTIDRGNRRYLTLRKFLRSGFAFRLQQLLPLKFLWWVARLSSELSKESSGPLQERLAEIMLRFAQGKFREGYDAVILGHCHKPFLRRELEGERQKTFATLGDWIAHDSCLSYEEGHFTMQHITGGN